MDTEQARPSPFIEPLKALPMMLVSLVVVVGAVDLLLLWQPSILLSLRADWQRAVPNGQSGATLLAAVVVIASIALSATLLTVFVRAVRSATYLCLAPIWVGLCMLVIGRMQVQLPLPLPTPAFVSICALLFVGSGVLFESRSSTSNLAGVALSVLPITVLLLGYLLGAVPFDTSAALLLIVLSLAAAGAPVIAMASRARGAQANLGASPDSSEQIAELLERVRESENRAEHAERQLAMQQPSWNEAPRIAANDDGMLVRDQGASGRGGWMVATLMLMVTLGGYFFGLAPLRAELAKTNHDKETLAARHGEEIAALQAKAERERKLLEEQLAAATAAPEPPPAPSGPSAKAAAALLATSRSDDNGERPDQSILDAERAGRLEARRAARIARQEQLKAEREAEDAQADAEAAERAQAAEARRAARIEKREQAAAEREARAAQRAAQREERAAQRAARLAARTSSAEDEEEEEEEAPEPKHAAPPPAPEPKDSMESGNDDPLEGLDGL